MARNSCNLVVASLVQPINYSGDTCPIYSNSSYFLNRSDLCRWCVKHAGWVSCYTGNCNKLLDSGSVTEHDGDAFCKPCYGKLFGPKGYGFAGGSAGLSANDTHRERPQRWFSFQSIIDIAYSSKWLTNAANVIKERATPTRLMMLQSLLID